MAQTLSHLSTFFAGSNQTLITLANNPVPLTAHEALSGIFGSISLCAWIFVLVPQLYENYTSSSASGVSLLFISIWLLGDITNLIGSIWAQLVPTVTALAVYFCFADAVLIVQVVYYEYWYNRARKGEILDVDGDEEEPLLGRRTSGGSIGLPGSHVRDRRRSSHGQANGAGGAETTGGSRRSSALAKIDEDAEDDRPSAKRPWLINVPGILAICILGTAGWAICFKTGVWTPHATPEEERRGLPGGKDKSTPLGAEILGYISAVAYLGARIPQIVKNWREQSCEGLSLLFFLLSLAGNLTYGAGILFHSTDSDYIVKNLPWLIGSLGTIAEDVLIFVQFKLYADGKRKGDDEAIA